MIIWYLLNAWFRNIKHPEKYATFIDNIYGDPINIYNARSLWKVNWFPIPLKHNKLYGIL